MGVKRRLSLEPLESRRMLSRSTLSTLVSSAPSTKVGATVTFTDRVTSAAGVPTGSVESLIDGRAYQIVPLRNGVASVSDAKLAAGMHKITAEFLQQFFSVWGASAATVSETITAPQPASSSQFMTGGTLALPSSGGSSAATLSGGTLNMGGTVELTGGVSNLNSGGTFTVTGTGTALAEPGTINVNSQTPFQIPFTNSGEPIGQVATVYTGNTVVVDGENAATLTASQILQSTLTILPSQTLTVTNVAAPLGYEFTAID